METIGEGSFGGDESSCLDDVVDAVNDVRSAPRLQHPAVLEMDTSRGYDRGRRAKLLEDEVLAASEKEGMKEDGSSSSKVKGDEGRRPGVCTAFELEEEEDDKETVATEPGESCMGQEYSCIETEPGGREDCIRCIPA